MRRNLEFESDLIDNDFVIVKNEIGIDYLRYSGSLRRVVLYKPKNEIISFDNENEAKSFCDEINERRKNKRKKTSIVIFSIIMFGIILSIAYIYLKISITNEEIKRRNLIEQKYSVVQSNYNSMKIILKDKYKITKESTVDLEKLTTAALNAKYGDKDPMFLMLNGNDPQFSIDAYKELLQSIEQLRITYGKEEEEMLNMYYTYKTFVSTFVNSFFVKNNIGDEKMQPVLTKGTKQTFETKIEEDSTF